MLVAPAILTKLVPSTLDCHCTVGAGLPDAAAINKTDWFKQLVTLAGCAVTTGGWFTVAVALPELMPVHSESNTAVTV